MIVADAGPLIALAKLNRLSILESLFGTVLVPDVVSREVLAKPGVETQILEAALASFCEVVTVTHDSARPFAQINPAPGEAYALALANERGIPLLVDDRQGRTIARRFKVEAMGTVGVLVIAKVSDLIPIVGPEILQLRTLGYWISDNLLSEALRLAGEEHSSA